MTTGADPLQLSVSSAKLTTLLSTKDTTKELTKDFYHIHKWFFTYGLVGTQKYEREISPLTSCLHWSQTSKDKYTKSEHSMCIWNDKWMTVVMVTAMCALCFLFKVTERNRRRQDILFIVSYPHMEVQAGKGENGKSQFLWKDSTGTCFVFRPMSHLPWRSWGRGLESSPRIKVGFLQW